MTLELLANQGREKVYSSLAGRNYNDILAKRQNLLNCFGNNVEQEHKRELVARIKDVSFVNDARSINPNATWFSMESVTNKIVWIADVDSKDNNFTCLIPIAREKVGAMICFGKERQNLKNTFEGLIHNIFEVNNINEAVMLANAIAESEDVVMYSPANGVEDEIDIKGEGFRHAVNTL